MSDLREGVMRMPFGKYKDVDLCFVNSGYLKWLIDQDWFVDKDSDLVLEVERELKLRDMDSSHFYIDKVEVNR